MSRATLAAIGLAALLACTAPAASAAPDTPYCERAPEPRAGISETGRTQVTERVLELALRSEAMGRVERVRVLLPRGYDPGAGRRYPVLYLLHGAFDDRTAYLGHGLADMLGDLPLIVVMPDGGASGGYLDWYGTVVGRGERAPAWETYHLDELVPFVDRAFPTTGDASGRFVAGLSMGGGGAMKYAAARPGLFGAAGEFSGAVNTTLSYPVYPAAINGVWLATLVPGLGPAAHCMMGDPVTKQVIWRDQDPVYLAANLAGTALFLTTGDGRPGPLDPPGAVFDPVEWTVGQMNAELAAALRAAGVPHTTDFYGAGTHTWPYWQRALKRFLAWLEPRIGVAVEPPARYAMRSARERFGAWGWSFHARREVREFAYLEDVSRDGLVAVGSGRLEVVTGRLYEPGGSYLAGGEQVTAGGDGRLRFTVALGPSHTEDQLRFDERAADGWRRRHVRIGRATP